MYLQIYRPEPFSLLMCTEKNIRIYFFQIQPQMLIYIRSRDGVFVALLPNLKFVKISLGIIDFAISCYTEKHDKISYLNPETLKIR